MQSACNCFRVPQLTASAANSPCWVLPLLHTVHYTHMQVMVFEGTCYVTPLLGAYLADSFWGRYKTIWVFSSIYFMVRIMRTFMSELNSHV